MEKNIELIINKLAKHYKFNKMSEFANFLGIATTTLSSWKSRNSIDYDLVYSKCVGINANWLLTGKGEMFINDCPKSCRDEQNKELEAHYSESGGIPLIPLDAMAGFGSGNSQTIMEYECEKYIVPSFTGAEFLIKVTGDSMFPKYYSGDVVACKKIFSGTFFQWNKVYVIDSEQGVLIKRVKKSTSQDKITLVSENTEYDPFEIRITDINSLAIVVGLIRIE